MDIADVPRHRPLAFDKMESLIKEMQDPETGVPVRSQKLFLTFIPSAFMGYDLVEWLMERFNLDETNNVEAINLANQLCLYGYFFPVNDSKNLVLKDDSSLYRFQSPYYWPWQAPRVAGGSSAPTLGPDNVEYAIYLVKRTLRNKQRHGLEDYELEALANLKKNLSAKWDFITMQAEEQVRLAKERKKGDKIVSDSQERAYWRVARPPPGMPSALEPCPVPVRNRHTKPKKRTIQQITREIEHLKTSLDRTRVKTSIALEALLAYSETFAPYDPWLTTPQPSNPWVSDDTLFWQINSPLVDVPSEKRVQRWSLSMEELVSDPTGLQEFTSFLRKEYSHENIRFWLAVMDLRRSGTKQIPRKLEQIYEEFLKPGAPCEINIDGATAEKVVEGLRSGSRYAFDHAADHVYGLLLKKDCYPRFIRSDHFQRLLTEGRNVHQKKAKFFNFGGQVKKKPCSTSGTSSAGSGSIGLSRRRGSDRSLSGSAHELAVCAAQPPRPPEPPPHSHSQSNLCDIVPFRDPADDDADVMPWECSSREGVYGSGGRRRQDSAADSGSSSSDVSSAVVAERRKLPQQSTLDGGLRGAPPPLRRLSAVEPRHLAPLASPPRTPRPTPAVSASPVTHPHPTPTISVSSAPEDDSPEESRSLAPSEEPSSVFASADATPTEPMRNTLATIDDSERATSDDESKIEVKVHDSSMTTPVLVTSTTEMKSEQSCDENVKVIKILNRESSMKECVASTEDSCDSIDVQKNWEEVSVLGSVANEPLFSDVCESLQDASTRSGSIPSSSRTGTIRSDSVKSGSVQSVSTTNESVHSESTESGTVDRVPTLPSSTTLVPLKVASAASSPATPSIPCSTSSDQETLNISKKASSSAPLTPQTAMVPMAVVAPLAPVAPLAVCEDLGVDEDNIEKVPSTPLQRVPVDSKAQCASEQAQFIAHKDVLPSAQKPKDHRNDNKDLVERKQRNDICPWEDENSCESDAPFVKTYATLGYL